MNDDNLEQHLSSLQNPKPGNSAFRENLRKRLVNIAKEQSESLLDYARSDIARDDKRTTTKMNPFWKFSFSTMLASFALLFCMSSATAYVAIPDVKEAVNEVVGIAVKGTLEVSTDPDGAKIYIDDEYVGVTPLKTKLEVGSYKMRIELEGFEEIVQDIEIEEKEITEFDIILKSEESYYGWLDYTSEDSSFGFMYPEDYEIEYSQEERVRLSSDGIEVNIGLGIFPIIDLPDGDVVMIGEEYSVYLYKSSGDNYYGGMMKISEDSQSGLLIGFEFSEDVDLENPLYLELVEILESVWVGENFEDQVPVSYGV